MSNVAKSSVDLNPTRYNGTYERLYAQPLVSIIHDVIRDKTKWNLIYSVQSFDTKKIVIRDKLNGKDWGTCRIENSTTFIISGNEVSVQFKVPLADSNAIELIIQTLNSIPSPKGKGDNART